jgi:xanthine dehydrogenase accessory factor
MLVGAAGRLAGTIGGGAVERRATEDAQAALAEHRSGSRRYMLAELGMICGGEITVEFRCLAPGAEAEAFAAERDARRAAETARAIIFGGGHVGTEIARLLPRLGWQTTVFDDRAEFASAERFPGCGVICGDYADIGANLSLQAGDYIIVVTSGHAGDFACVHFALQGEGLAYVGCIGSRAKAAALRERLVAAGDAPDAVAGVHMPIGLNLGGRTPEEIAVSIAAQMIEARYSL